MRPVDADSLMEKLNGIWDCNDMTFAPVDGCCIDADCKSCRWRETIEYVKRLVQNQPTASPWHRVEDRLPDDTRDVLAVRRYGNDLEKQEVIVAHLSVIMDMKRGFDKWWNATNITHWMPFPEPPKEEA